MLKEKTEQYQLIQEKLSKNIHFVLQQKKQAFTTQMSLLDNLSPLNTIKRGYAIAKNKDNILINDNNLPNNGEALTVQLAEHQILCQTTNVVTQGLCYEKD